MLSFQSVSIAGRLGEQQLSLLKIAWEGEAPAEPHTMENVIFHAAQQELRPPKYCPS